MKITSPARAIPDESHRQKAVLFEIDPTSFELSTIRPEDASIAVEMLIGNYASPIDAVIRELYVNAADSHRAASQTRPVEITMPSQGSPFFTVRDFGLGLSAQEMAEVFTRPAASSKRDENASTGGLGIGAKAPFTVADTFVVTGRKHGLESTLVMARIDGRLMHRVTESGTHDPALSDGVEIVVPVKLEDIERWWKALSRVHFWWDSAGSVITNLGEDLTALSAVDPLPNWHERILKGSAIATDRPVVINTPDLRKSTVVMGQIGYDIPASILPTAAPLIYSVPIGALDIAPTRESIVDTARNATVLKKMYRAWAEVRFSFSLEILRDPNSSVLSILRLEHELTTNGLRDHFMLWIRDLPSKRKGTALDRLSPNRAMMWQIGSRVNDRSGAVVYGVPSAVHASHDKLLELVNVYGYRDGREIAFLDPARLTSSKQRVLTAWARTEKLLVILITPSDLEQLTYRAGFGYWGNGEFTRPFAAGKEIDWIDPAEITPPTRVRKPAGPPATSESTIEATRTVLGRRKSQSFTVQELLTWAKEKPSHRLVIDTTNRLRGLQYPTPKNVILVRSGEHAASVLRELAGTRALTADEFQTQGEALTLASLSSAQKRFLADVEIAREPAISKLFQHRTAWIAETQDSNVRKVAAAISRVVTKANTRVNFDTRRKEQDPFVEDAMAARGWLRSQMTDGAWLIEHTSLNKYGSVLVAGTATGIGRTWHRHAQNSVVDLVRTTIRQSLDRGSAAS